MTEDHKHAPSSPLKDLGMAILVMEAVAVGPLLVVLFAANALGLIDWF